MADSGRQGGDLHPEINAVIGMVADPDNWRGLNAAQKAELQAEIDKATSKEQRRTIDAAVKKQKERRRR